MLVNILKFYGVMINVGSDNLKQQSVSHHLILI